MKGRVIDLSIGLVLTAVIALGGFILRPILDAPGRIDVLEEKVKTNQQYLKRIDERTEKIYDLLIK